jgi:hypothetical protein
MIILWYSRKVRTRPVSQQSPSSSAESSTFDSEAAIVRWYYMTTTID